MAAIMKVDIDGMSCDHCVQTLEKGLGSISGVKKVNVNLKAKQALVEVSQASDDLNRQIESKVIDLGYEVRKISS